MLLFEEDGKVKAAASGDVGGVRIISLEDSAPPGGHPVPQAPVQQAPVPQAQVPQAQVPQAPLPLAYATGGFAGVMQPVPAANHRATGVLSRPYAGLAPAGRRKCRYWPLGTCKFGAQCHFLHE